MPIKQLLIQLSSINNLQSFGYLSIGTAKELKEKLIELYFQ